MPTMSYGDLAKYAVTKPKKKSKVGVGTGSTQSNYVPKIGKAGTAGKAGNIGSSGTPNTIYGSTLPVGTGIGTNTGVYGSGPNSVSSAGANVLPTVPIGPGAGLGSPGTDWMEGIKPDAAEMLFQEPDAFLRQVMARMGMDPDVAIGAAQLASPMARNMNELALIMLGADSDFSKGEFDQAGNWMANFLANQMSPSGRYVDFGTGMDNLLNTRTAGADKLSALGSILGIDDPSGQARAFNSLATSLASTSLHPLWQRALQDELTRQGNAFISQSSRTTDMGPYNTWLQSQGF